MLYIHFFSNTICSELSRYNWPSQACQASCLENHVLALIQQRRSNLSIRLTFGLTAGIIRHLIGVLHRARLQVSTVVGFATADGIATGPGAGLFVGVVVLGVAAAEDEVPAFLDGRWGWGGIFERRGGCEGEARTGWLVY